MAHNNLTLEIFKRMNTCHTGNVDDVALGLDEVGQDFLHEDEGWPGVDVHAAVVSFERQAEGVAVAEDAGRVDEDVDT